MWKRVTYKNFSSLNRNLPSHSTPHKYLLTILKCPLSVLWRCTSYREIGYSKLTEKWPGPALGVRPIEVSVLQRCPLRESWLYINNNYPSRSLRKILAKFRKLKVLQVSPLNLAQLHWKRLFLLSLCLQKHLGCFLIPWATSTLHYWTLPQNKKTGQRAKFSKSSSAKSV